MEGCEFIVDVSSRYASAPCANRLGSLVLRDGGAFLVGMPLNDAFGDPEELPLWGEFQRPSGDQAVGFTRWSLVLRDGEHTFELWRHVGDTDT